MSAAPVIRFATREDLPAIVKLLANDELGAAREDPGEPLHENYLAAFEAMADERDNDLVVMERDGACVGCLQIVIFSGFDRLGSRRGWIEGVRVAAHLRGQGLGRALLVWTIEHARRKGCAFVQLAINKNRRDGIRFYQSLGFVGKHEGMTLTL